MTLSSSTFGLLLEAYHLAARTHRDQRHGDAHGSPWINRPIEAAQLLATAGGVTDTNVLIAAVLHHAIGDPGLSPVQIERLFGPDVRSLVEEMTEAPDLTKDERRRRQLASARTASPGARLIYLAVRVAALSTLPCDWTADERRHYLTWVEAMAAALKGTNRRLETVLADRIRKARTCPPSGATRSTRSAPTVRHESAWREFTLVVAKEFGRLQSQLGRMEEQADRLAALLAEYGFDVPVPNSTAETPSPPPPPLDDPRLCDLAERGVGRVELRDLEGRSAAVSIDGAPEFALTPTLADLLRILMSGVGPEADGFPPFLTFQDIATRLRAATGRPASERAVVVGISRLRNALLKRGKQPPRLVETAKGLRARFRIRRAKG